MRALNYDFGGLIKSLSYLVNGSTKSGYNVSMELDKFFSDLNVRQYNIQIIRIMNFLDYTSRIQI